MPEITVDMTLAAETIPAGPYLLAIVKYEVKNSKSSTYPYVLFTVSVQEGPFAGFKMREIVSTSPAAAAIAGRFFTAVGLDYNDPTTGRPRADFTYDPEDLMGIRVYAIVGDDSSDDYGTRSVVKRWINEDDYDPAVHAKDFGTENGIAIEVPAENAGGRRRGR